MAQTINTITTKGLFKNSAFDLTTVTEAGDNITLTADISDCEDSILFIVDLSGNSGGEYAVQTVDVNGKINNTLMLTPGKLNAFKFTAHGLKKPDGKADFKLSTSIGAGFANIGVKVGIFKHIDVVNH